MEYFKFFLFMIVNFELILIKKKIKFYLLLGGVWVMIVEICFGILVLKMFWFLLFVVFVLLCLIIKCFLFCIFVILNIYCLRY